MNRNVLDTVLKAVALAMGVVVIVLNTLGSLKVENGVAFLGIGLTCLAIAALQK